MEVILLEKIENLGSLGDIVNVRSGYARNYLVPQQKAKMATAANIADFEERRAELEKIQADSLEKAKARASGLEDMSLTISANAGQEGKLFGSVTGAEIADAIAAAGVQVEKSEIRMPEGPIRMLGEYEVGVHLHADVDATVKVIVEAESSEDEE